jgi:uncharacterized membrane-anchored protein YhcB (DUF1043 family)
MDQNEKILELEKRIDELKKELDEYRCKTLSFFASVRNLLQDVCDRQVTLEESVSERISANTAAATEWKETVFEGLKVLGDEIEKLQKPVGFQKTDPLVS